MGHNIPVFFFPVSASEIQDSEFTKEFVEELLSSKYSARDESGIREVSSRDWWYQNVVSELTRRMGINGLEFVTWNIALLGGDMLHLASEAISQLLVELLEDIPATADEQEKEYSGVTELRKADRSLAFSQSRSEFKISPSVDSGFEAVVGFFSFLKTLQSAIQNALANQQCLVYYRPQP